ncbi:unnamed protein product [Blepharisma stoltei]|uniref:DRBM domain-containing protein n=1 Tax=Blepharisma stoltei TaxID=1481888 RepID=A0AAU9JNV2_9CILI|nr:unnamed protein product [Blepharisma stoltei]
MDPIAKNPISILNELAINNKIKFQFEIKPKGSEFECVIYQNNRAISKGTGRKKQDAKLKAAESALDIIANLPLNSRDFKEKFNSNGQNSKENLKQIPANEMKKEKAQPPEEEKVIESPAQVTNEEENEKRANRIISSFSENYNEYMENKIKLLELSYDDMIDMQIVSEEIKEIEEELKCEGINLLHPAGSFVMSMIRRNHIEIDLIAEVTSKIGALNYNFIKGIWMKLLILRQRTLEARQEFNENPYKSFHPTKTVNISLQPELIENIENTYMSKDLPYILLSKEREGNSSIYVRIFFYDETNISSALAHYRLYEKKPLSSVKSKCCKLLRHWRDRLRLKGMPIELLDLLVEEFINENTTGLAFRIIMERIAGGIFFPESSFSCNDQNYGKLLEEWSLRSRIEVAKEASRTLIHLIQNKIDMILD